MSERTAALGTAGHLPTFEYEGKVYRFGLITQSVMEAMERHLFDRYADPITRHREHLDTEHYKAKMDALFARDETGEFAFEGPAMLEHLATAKGAVQIFSLLMGTDQDTALAMMQTHGPELNALFAQVKRQSFPPATADPDPKARGRRGRR